MRMCGVCAIDLKYLGEGDPPPINESICGVNPDSFWTLFKGEGNGEETVHGGADHRAFAES
jgi:hypothetical protein